MDWLLFSLGLLHGITVQISLRAFIQARNSWIVPRVWHDWIGMIAGSLIPGLNLVIAFVILKK